MPFDQFAAVDEDFLFPPEVLEALATHLGMDELNDRLEALESPGLIMVWPKGDSIPTGYLLCDGTAVSRATYAALFAVIGTTEGVGDGSTTFNLPNLKGRTVVGQDPAQAEFDVVGETGGSKTHTLTTGEMPNHNHGGGTGLQSADHGHVGTTDGVGDHTHGYPAQDSTPATVQTTGGGGVVADDSHFAQATNGAGAHAHTFSTGGASANHSHSVGAEGGGGAHNNLQPYSVRRYIIKT